MPVEIPRHLSLHTADRLLVGRPALVSKGQVWKLWVSLLFVMLHRLEGPSGSDLISHERGQKK